MYQQLFFSLIDDFNFSGYEEVGTVLPRIPGSTHRPNHYDEKRKFLQKIY